MTFAEFGFNERIQQGINDAGFEAPMPVQAQCFELLINNHRDVYAQSQTGTGKTAAFLLSILQLLVDAEKHKGDKALIIVPTRELAVQIEQEAKMLAQHLDLHIGSVFGGVGYGGQERMLEKGVDILIGTPGRLIDFNKQNKINLKEFGFLVIDEADRLFDMGFLPDLRKIMKGARPNTERHTLLFSATMNTRVGNLAWEYMNNPGEVIIEPDKKTVDTVTQELYHVGKDEKMQLLLGIMKRDNPGNAVIFTNTRHSAWEVAKRMEVNGYAVQFLMGDLPQAKRMKIVNDVKNGNHKFLVATDIAARGLHIDELQMVINYDVPLEPESYVHRIGRTARVGKGGKTVTMACEEYVYGLSPIEKLLGQKIPVSWADESLLMEDQSAGMRFPHQDRYREMGKESQDGRGGARSNPRELRSSENNRRPSRKKSAGSANHGTVNGRKPLDPRTAKVQSAVSSVLSDDVHERPAPVHKDSRRSTRTEKNRKIVPPKNQNRKHSPKTSRSEKNKPRVEAPKRIGSDVDIHQRLEYYRKKYGEDFQLVGSSSKKVEKSQKKQRSRPLPHSDATTPSSTVQQENVAPNTQNTASNAPNKFQSFLSRLFEKK